MQRKHPLIKLMQENENEEAKRHKLSSHNTDLPGKGNDNNQPSTSRAVVPTNLENISDDVITHSPTPFPKKIGFPEKKKLDEKLLELVTKDYQPFSIVEDEGFRNFTNALNSSYILPSRKTLSNTLLAAKFEEVKMKTSEIMKRVKSVTITTDCWTSVNNDGFIAVTAHFIDDNFLAKSILLEVAECNTRHTSINLANELRKTTSEWGIEHKILLCLSDNAANIKKAVCDELHWTHLGCVAHTINLIVQGSLTLDLVKPILTKISDMVSHFKRSSLAKSKLDFYQKQNGKTPKKLIQAVSTRWNSVYYMLERIKELKEEVRTSLAAIGKEDWPMLTHQEYKYVEEITQILAPLESTTVFMSAEKQVTLSSVIIITNGLKELYKELEKKCQFSLLGKSILQSILSGIENRFKNMEINDTLLLSTFLDPRFKHVGFSTESATEKAKTLATNALTALINKKTDELLPPLTSTADPEVQASREQVPNEEQFSIWRSFDKKALGFVPVQSKQSRAQLEIQRYLEEPLLSRSVNPLEWWKINTYNYPYLSELVTVKFGTVATSVPCERMFSKSGQIISDRRNRISSNKVKQIMFVNQNDFC
ncbi:zinc finger BED domain-containing protein 1-like [Sitophilus oryzae]|uniref:Zinc finger BED domain-containing protein 1-like n=1 Tax=Sitophilus oryzae TaxID=7048 RepID=A0A6J2YAN4_SITOR|nr:zinc finger BED domain-containing protein 1-like [Sitophilus oryzae]